MCKKYKNKEKRHISEITADGLHMKLYKPLWQRVQLWLINPNISMKVTVGRRLQIRPESGHMLPHSSQSTPKFASIRCRLWWMRQRVTRYPLQGSVSGTVRSALHTDEVNHPSQCATVISLCSVSATVQQWRLHETHTHVNVCEFGCKAPLATLTLHCS